MSTVSKRTAKLVICSILIVIAFVILLYKLGNGFDIIEIILWLFVYLVIAIVVGDVLRTIEAGKKTPWIVGVLCLPIFAIPLYTVIHGKQSAL